MRPIRSILVPTDFSPCSMEAMLYAYDLARTLGAQVTLLHVHPAKPFDELEAERRQSDSELHDLERRALAHGGVAVATQSRAGSPVEEILRAAREGDYDLVVMGTHGRTGLVHLALGSVAEKVLRHSERPVLTVRTPAPQRTSVITTPPIL